MEGYCSRPDKRHGEPGLGRWRWKWANLGYTLKLGQVRLVDWMWHVGNTKGDSWVFGLLWERKGGLGLLWWGGQASGVDPSRYLWTALSGHMVFVYVSVGLTQSLRAGLWAEKRS